MTPKTRHRGEETEEGIEWEMAGMPAWLGTDLARGRLFFVIRSGVAAEILIIRRQTRPGRAGDRRLAIRLPGTGLIILASTVMSLSSEDDNIPLSPAVSLQSSSNKKRRVQNQRACDRCRQKKSMSSFPWHPYCPLCSSFYFLPFNCSPLYDFFAPPPPIELSR